MNGEQFGTAKNTSPTTLAMANLNLYIGYTEFWRVATCGVDCSYAEVEVYSKKLTPQEVHQSYVRARWTKPTKV